MTFADIFTAIGKTAAAFFLFLLSLLTLPSPSAEDAAPTARPADIRKEEIGQGEKKPVREQKKNPKKEERAAHADTETPAEKATVRDEGPDIHPSSPPVVSDKDIAAANTAAREALVNIFCSGNLFGSGRAISGSGVVVDPRGLVLTNAHLAQYFLLEKEGEFDCLIRTGAPARIAYEAELVYISPRWVRDNAHFITKSDPTGTGEYDFAFLRLSPLSPGSPGGSFPDPFSFLPLFAGENPREAGRSVLIAGYPAGFLGSVAIFRQLYPASAVSFVDERFTFSQSVVDILSFKGAILSQKGVSGSGVVDIAEKGVVGIIATSTDAPETGDRTLYAITGAHISRSLQEETGFDYVSFIARDLSAAANDFADTLAPELKTLLISAAGE